MSKSGSSGKVVYRQQTVDRETGEVKESVTVRKEKQQPQPYCTVFLERIDDLKHIGAMQMAVFFQLAKLSEWNTNIVFLNDYNRKNIAYSLGLQPESIRVAVANLSKMNYVRRVRNTVYRINPCILFYGTFQARDEILMNGQDWTINLDARIKRKRVV